MVIPSDDQQQFKMSTHCCKNSLFSLPRFSFINLIHQLKHGIARQIGHKETMELSRELMNKTFTRANTGHAVQINTSKPMKIKRRNEPSTDRRTDRLTYGGA